MPDPCPVVVDPGCNTGVVVERVLSAADLSICVADSQPMLDLCKKLAKDLYTEKVSLRTHMQF